MATCVVINNTPYSYEFADLVFKAKSATPVSEKVQKDLEGIRQFVELVEKHKFEITDKIPESMKTETQRLNECLTELAALKSVLAAREARIVELESLIEENR